MTPAHSAASPNASSELELRLPGFAEFGAFTSSLSSRGRSSVASLLRLLGGCA